MVDKEKGSVIKKSNVFQAEMECFPRNKLSKYFQNVGAKLKRTTQRPAAAVHRGGDPENGEETPSVAQTRIIQILADRGTKWLICLLVYNAFIVVYFCTWVYSSNSLVLAAYTNTLFFNLSSLMVCMITIWVEQQNFSRINLKNLTTGHSKVAPECQFRSISMLGLERYEVWCVLISSSVAILIGSFVTVAGIVRTKAPSTLHIDLFYTFVGISTYFITTITYPDAQLGNIVRVVLPFSIFTQINPILGYNVISAGVVCSVCFVERFQDIHSIDTIGAFCLNGLTATLMLPLVFFTSKVICHNFTHCMSERLDRCLREALFLDGVMEFRNEKFWTMSFGKISGTLDVRIRKNANEDYVLKNVMRHLSRVITNVTVHKYQEERDSASTSMDHYSVEYYIDEILTHPIDSDVKFSPAAEKDIPILNINDMIGPKRNNESDLFLRPENDPQTRYYLYRPKNLLLRDVKNP